MTDDGTRVQVDHVLEVQMSAPRSRRAGSLRVVDGWEIRAGVPTSRDECRNGPRPCPYVRCRHHLWLIHGEDRQGRRHHPGQAPASTLRPATSVSCALDVAERENTAQEIAELLGITQRRVQQILREVLAKLRANGVELHELLG